MADDIPAVPLHFLPDEADEPDAPEVNPAEMEEIEDPVDLIDPDRKVVPNERLAMEHFTAHYSVFADAVKRNINEPLTQRDIIQLHRTYSMVWGHGSV